MSKKARDKEIIDAALEKASDVSEFIQGAKWADEHPRKGLIELETVYNTLKKMLSSDVSEAYANAFVNDFKELIEKEN